MKRKVILATSNAGKLVEIRQACAELALDLQLPSDFNITEIAETGLTFIENALLKARHACQMTGLPAIADDSGLEVDALQGAPGIYSARYAGEPVNPARNINKLLAALADVPTEERTARFQCVIVLLRHTNDAMPLICQGTWEGSILFSPQGENGFGYDPVFYLPSHHCSAAELPLAVKNKMSHRGQALQQLKNKIMEKTGALVWKQ